MECKKNVALRRIGVKGVEIRKPEQLGSIDSLIIPGGESTTMAKLAELHNLVSFISVPFLFLYCDNPTLLIPVTKILVLLTVVLYLCH